MFLSVILLAAALMGREATAHWTMPYLVFNGTISKEFEYVRHTISPYYSSKVGNLNRVAPQLGSELLANNITCGRNATQYGSSTKTATLIAGDEVGFHVNTDQGELGIVHGGPAQIYMAKVPTGMDIKKFAGYEPSAQWFKIASFAQKNDTAWITLRLKEIRFKIPKTTPPGFYLLRIEAFAPADYAEGSQWYVNCAQVEIRGPGGGSPSGFAKFPGTYRIDSPGILVSTAVSESKNLAGYKAPGPDVWTG